MIISAERVRHSWGVLADWWLDPRDERDEAANALAMTVMLLPVLLGAFGLGFDVARNSYVRNTLQGSIDQALASGASVTAPGLNGTVVIDEANAPTTVRQIYSLNRQKNAGLQCTGTPYCWNEPLGAPKVTNGVDAAGNTTSKITYTVQEKTNNFFLSIVGVPSQTYTVTGTAEITSRNE